MVRRAVVTLFIMFFALGLWTDSTKGADAPTSTKGAGAPTLEELKNLPVAGPLGLSARGTIEKFVGHWVQKLADAEKFEDIVKARKALTDGYEVHDSPHWQVTYAEVSAEKIPTLLLLSDRVKQIQAGMTIAAMPQYTIQPALEQMARHKNPAVRYWAARGYRSSARKMLLFPQRTKMMCATLEQLGREESGPVLTVVLWTLIIDPDDNQETIDLLRSTMDKIWFTRLGDLHAGKGDVIEAYRKAIVFLMPLTSNKADEKKILQLLVDAMEAASQGFNESPGGKNSDGQSWMDLLSDLESKLATVTNTDKTPIRDILADPTRPAAQKAAEIRLNAVLEYWRPLLEKLDVKPRPAPVTTTKPTTTAAITTTTAPAKQ